MRSYRYFEGGLAINLYWDIVDSIEDKKEYPYCNDLLHWLKGVGWREYERRVRKRQNTRSLLHKALRIVKVWRYPHYAAVVLRHLGVIRT